MPRIDRRSRLAVVLAGLTFLAGPTLGQDAPPPKPTVAALTTEQKAKNLESFDVVWKTIRDTHFDPTLGGLDWNAVRDELRPQVEKAETTAEARALMTRALDRLHQTHFGIVPREAYQALDDPKKGNGETGIDVRVLDGRAIVISVLDDSPAQKAGVRPGWVLVKAGDKTASEIFQSVEKAYAGSGLIPVYKARTLTGRLTGAVGSTVSAEFLDAQDRLTKREIPLAEPQGVVARFGNLPDFHVRFVSKKVDRSVGYVSLNIFFDLSRVLGLYAEAIESHRDAEGLIIDLRGNPGGIGAMALGMGGWLISGDKSKLGTMITRDGSLLFALNPRSSPFEGPVAVLVDELSMSTSEILAGGLKDLKRARIFGTKTPGAALPSRFDILPNGDRFQYAFANYVSTGGKPLEGVGVTPDVLTPLDRSSLLSGRDPAVEAAIRWIREPKAKP